MSTALAERPTETPTVAATPPTRGLIWTPGQIATLQQTIAKGTTPEQFRLFLESCRQTGLNPFQGEIACVIYGGDMRIQIPLAGYRAIAHESGVFAGEEGPLFCGKDGVYADTWLADGPPHAAKFTVYRHDFERSFPAVVHFQEFKRIGQALWEKIPIHMLGKTAAVHSFKKAYRAQVRRVQAQIEALGVTLTEDRGDEPEPAALEAAVRAAPALPAVRTTDDRTIEFPSGQIVAVDVDALNTPPPDEAAAFVADSAELTAEERERDGAIDRYGVTWDQAQAAGVAGRYPRVVPGTASLAQIRDGIEKLEERIAAANAKGAKG